ncbi:sensor histidine kinase [Pedobacter heparinus]|uniref:sensor histidine kinase n=1 Tax=Pedobacter heparinus TaxID=984 RepID=UPI002931664C|nr:histidine kinase [Pedobacter heparinus]
MNSIYGFFGNRLYFILTLALFLPSFIAMNSYTSSIGVHDNEAVAFAATVTMILCVFSGRYFSQIWVSTLTTYPKPALTALGLIVFVCLMWLVFRFDHLSGNRGIHLVMFWVPMMIISFTLGVMIKAVHSISQKQLKDAQSEAAHSKSELHVLQSQLSPHFLFNTLNNLYGLSISDHEKIPALLLKLSELLRYSVYDINELYVPLKDEIAYIKNYIDFEKLRLGTRLSFNAAIDEINDPNIRLAPVLLIVFIENAFKHSKNSAAADISIDIQIKLWTDSILFSVRNTYGLEDQQQNSLNKSSGMGLPNVQKRLQLLYPDAHALRMYRDEKFHCVDLRLKIR